MGEVAPMPETCDHLDNDCDGVVDNGVLSRCGDCNSNCGLVGTPTSGPNRFMPTPGNSDGVSTDPNGNLVLNASQSRSYFVWIANSGEGTMSKLDSRTGREVARYATIRPQDPRVMGMTLPPWNEACVYATDNNGTNGAGNCGSRTAVDLNGDVWIANRAFGGQGSVSKVANFTESCIDYNMNGRIDTSRDKNGNGVIDVQRDASGLLTDLPPTVVDDPNAEFLGIYDECIVATIPIGAPHSWPRALAIDAGDVIGPDGMHHQTAGNPWVGVFLDQPTQTRGRFYQLNADTFGIMTTVAMPDGHHPYGATITSDQILFSTHIADGTLAAVDTHAGQLKIYPGEDPSGAIKRPAPMCTQAYGIAVDGKNRIWQGGWTCGGAYRFDPSAAAGSRWTEIMAPMGWGYTRGIAADTNGNVWVAHYTTPGRITRINADAAAISGTAVLTSTAPPIMTGSGPIGAGIDFDTNVWTVNHDASYSASKIIASRCVFPSPTADGMCPVFNYPVGVAPYTYSDFTGFALRNFTAPRGHYTVQVPGCPNNAATTWKTLIWTAVTPPGTAVSATIKSVDDPSQLPTAMAYGPLTPSPVDLSILPKSHLLEIEFELTTMDRGTSPIFQGYDVKYTCPFQL
jgi:streptogramin lyase